MARTVAERQDVIPVLGEIFRRYGFEGASIARITEHSGLGKGSLYHFFPGGKEEMAEAVLNHIQGWFEAEVFFPLENDEPAKAIERMFTSVDDYFRSGRRICLMGAFAMDETRDRFSDAVAGYFTRWIAALGKALRKTGMTVPEANRIAAEVIAGIQGSIILVRALGDEHHFSSMMESLAARCRL